MLAQREREEAIRAVQAGAHLRRLADRTAQRLVRKDGQPGHYLVEREGPGKISDRQRQREREPFAAQRHADIGPFARARAIVERRLGIACRQQFRKIGQPVETAREERRVVARPLDSIGPIAWHRSALPAWRRRCKRAPLPLGPGFATSAATPNPRRLLR